MIPCSISNKIWAHTHAGESESDDLDGGVFYQNLVDDVQSGASWLNEKDNLKKTYKV